MGFSSASKLSRKQVLGVALTLVATCVLLLLAASPARAALHWYGDYEDGVVQHAPADPDTSILEGWRGSSPTNVNKAKLVASPRRQGAAALSVTAGPGDLGGNGKQRVEVDSTTSAARAMPGDDSWYAWSTYFPALESAGGVITQWKIRSPGPNCAGQSPNFSLIRESGRLLATLLGGQCIPGVEHGYLFELAAPGVELNVWHDFIAHVHWSASTQDGFAEVWYDGKLVVPRIYGANLYRDAEQTRTLSLRNGIYRSAAAAEGTNYYDATRVGTSYEDVATFNPSFETDLRDWQATGDEGFSLSSFQRSSAWASVGTQSLRTSGTHNSTTNPLARGVGQIGADRGTRVAPGREYEVKVDLHSYDPPASRGYRLRLDWFKADGSASSAAATLGAETGAGKTGDLTPALKVNTPADAAFAQLRVEAVSATANDFVDFAIDRVRFETDFGESQIGPDLVTNPSFEQSTTGWQSRVDSGLSLLDFKATSAWSDELATSVHLEGKHQGSAGQPLAYGITQPTGTSAMPVQAGQDYFARAVVDSLKAPADGGYRLRVRWFQANGEPAGVAQSKSGLRGQGIANGTVLPIFLATTAPPGAAYGSLAVEAVTSTVGETTEFYVDHALFRRTERSDRADLLGIGGMDPFNPNEASLPFPSKEESERVQGMDGWNATWDAGGEPIAVRWLRPVSLDPIDGDWSLEFIGQHDATTTEAIRGVKTAGDTTGIPIEGAQRYRLQSTVRTIDAPAGGYRLSAQMLNAAGKAIPGTLTQTGWESSGADLGQSLTFDAPANARYVEISVLARSAVADDTIDFKLDDVVLRPEPHVPRFEAGGYPATLKGAGLESFTAAGKTAKCTSTSLQGQLAAASSQLTLNAEFGGCLAGSSLVQVAMQSCHYTLNVLNAGPPYSGTLGVACDKAGEAITYSVYANGEPKTLVCTIKVGPQAAQAGLALANTGEGSERAIALEGEVKAIAYEQSGICGKASKSDGVLSGKAVLSGSNASKEPVGAYLAGKGLLLTGEESAEAATQPHFESNSYPATLKGAGLESFTAAGKTAKCTSTSLQGQLAAASSQLTLNAEFGGCLAGSSLVQVAMQSCHYTLNVLNAGPPYSGTLGVACDKAGEAITYSVYANGEPKTLVCTIKVGPQAAQAGLALANTGEGSERAIALEGEVKAIAYEQSGICGKASKSDGVLSGKAVLSG